MVQVSSSPGKRCNMWFFTHSCHTEQGRGTKMSACMLVKNTIFLLWLPGIYSMPDTVSTLRQARKKARALENPWKIWILKMQSNFFQPHTKARNQGFLPGCMILCPHQLQCDWLHALPFLRASQQVSELFIEGFFFSVYCCWTGVFMGRRGGERVHSFLLCHLINITPSEQHFFWLTLQIYKC